MSLPKCFISYSWDSENHKEWVRSLASELQKKGVETSLDQWDIHPGKDIPHYMETKIRESDYVLLICTPSFNKKANFGKGGVGYEKNIVTGEIYNASPDQKKFIPILRGDPSVSIPSYLKSKAYLDFRDDIKFRDSFELLLRHIFESPKYSRPKLGIKPYFNNNENILDDNKPSLSKDIDYFKEIFEYAFGSDGLDMAYGDAESFAWKWVSQHTRQDFEQFKKAFEYAFGSDGLDMAYGDALDFAWKWVYKNSK